MAAEAAGFRSGKWEESYSTKMFPRTALSLRNLAKAKPMGRHMSYVAPYKQPSMADLPVPQGSWKEGYSRNQRRYNLHLLLGIVFTGATFACASESGLVPLGHGPKMEN